jgi:uncharacterized protein YoxC
MEIAALVAAIAFAVLVVALAVPILRLRHTVDAATRAMSDVADQTGPLLTNVNGTVANVNTALGQVHTSLDGVNVQLARLDAITHNIQHVSTNVANLSTVVAAAASNPLVKVAAFGYGVRKAAANRRQADEERAVRDELKRRRRPRPGSGRTTVAGRG